MLIAMGSAFVQPVAGVAQTPPGHILVRVTGLHSDQGHVGCVLFSDASAFPGHTERARGRMFVVPRGREAICDFAAVERGTYAIATFHDENANGRMDQNFIGIPTEGTGCSNDARGRFGPPHFDDARFGYAGGMLTVPVTMHY
jgi:uncharacterized protein (DUF2141 family)